MPMHQDPLLVLCFMLIFCNIACVFSLHDMIEYVRNDQSKMSHSEIRIAIRTSRVYWLYNYKLVHRNRWSLYLGRYLELWHNFPETQWDNRQHQSPANTTQQHSRDVNKPRNVSSISLQLWFGTLRQDFLRFVLILATKISVSARHDVYIFIHMLSNTLYVATLLVSIMVHRILSYKNIYRYSLDFFLSKLSMNWNYIVMCRWMSANMFVYRNGYIQEVDQISNDVRSEQAYRVFLFVWVLVCFLLVGVSI